MSRKIYVVWKKYDGGIETDTFEIEGPINHQSVTDCVLNNLYYSRRDDFHFVISWQIEEDDN